MRLLVALRLLAAVFPASSAVRLGSRGGKHAQLLGLQKIIDAVTSWPAIVGLTAAAGLCAFVGVLLIAVGSGYEDEIQQKAQAAFLAQLPENFNNRLDEAERSKKDFDFADQVQQLIVQLLQGQEKS
jgi:hypothetical protein